MGRHSPGFLQLVEAAKATIQEMSVADLRVQGAREGAPVLIDVREDHEFERGAIPGAVHLSKGVIERDIERRYPDPQTPMVLYCGGGFRSALAAEALGRMGYHRVWSLAGGWRAWNASQ